VSGTLLVTGATGSVGSNVVALALAAGRPVRALVRSEADATVLAEMGAEPVVGDVTERGSVRDAVAGVNTVIHCAAVIGGTWSTATPEQFDAVNRVGGLIVLECALDAGVERVVSVLSAIVADSQETITERFRLVDLSERMSPYLRTKLASYYAGMARAAGGADVCFVIPGGVYGPTPFPDRALVPTIFTGTLLAAARGEIRRYLPMPIPWVLASDVARVCLAAAAGGRRGARYLALGRPEDVCSLPEFCNAFLHLIGSTHRVESVDPAAPGADQDPEFGGMVRMVRRTYPTPAFDATATNAELALSMTRLADGLGQTAAWLRDIGRL
jgi:dihydroflavonol-4-reductase